MTSNPGSPPRLLQRLGLVWLTLALSAPVVSRGEISFPLNGYYRPSRYMPVRVDSNTAVLFGDGILTTLMESKGEALVPVLITGSPARLNSTFKLQRLADDERLVAFNGDANKFTSILFPNQKIIAIALNPSDPVPGPPAAWEALDAIVLDPASMSRIDDAHRSAFLATGGFLAVPGETSPDIHWPWRRRGSLWVLQHDPSGPLDRLIDDAVFSPTYSWSPGFPPVLRRQIMIAGVLLSVACVALAMWRSKVAVFAIISLTLVSTVAVIAWRHYLGTVHQAGGDILVVSDSLFQKDSWLYERGFAADVHRLEWDGCTHPILASLSQLDKTQLKIVVNANGAMAFEYHAIPNETIAFMRRDIQPVPAPVPATLHGSPMRELAKEMYLSPGRKIAGEQSAAPGRWDTVIIENLTPTSHQ